MGINKVGQKTHTSSTQRPTPKLSRAQSEAIDLSGLVSRRAFKCHKENGVSVIRNRDGESAYLEGVEATHMPSAGDAHLVALRTFRARRHSF